MLKPVAKITASLVIKNERKLLVGGTGFSFMLSQCSSYENENIKVTLRKLRPNNGNRSETRGPMEKSSRAPQHRKVKTNIHLQKRATLELSEIKQKQLNK